MFNIKIHHIFAFLFFFIAMIFYAIGYKVLGGLGFFLGIVFETLAWTALCSESDCSPTQHKK